MFIETLWCGQKGFGWLFLDNLYTEGGHKDVYHRYVGEYEVCDKYKKKIIFVPHRDPDSDKYEIV